MRSRSRHSRSRTKDSNSISKMKGGPARAPGEGDPDVILDVIFEDGLFFLAIQNISSRPALDVVVTFRKPLMGLGGGKEISASPLFHGIPSLAPQKEIRTLLDSVEAFFARRQSALVEAQITFRDRARGSFATAIRHDLRIYKELAYVRRPEAPGVC